MPGQPLADVLVLKGGVVIKDHMHGLVYRNVVFQPIEETDELLMPVALHVAPEDRAIEHVERGKKRGAAVALIVMGQSATMPALQRQPQLGVVQGLDLAFLVN